MSVLRLNTRHGSTPLKVGEVMTQDFYVVAPGETIGQAALLMRDKDVGCLAVGTDDKLVGMLTDRDITVRAIARNKGAETPISEIMSGPVKYCFDDEDIFDVACNMAQLRVRRLPVVNREKRLVGFVSLANIAASDDAGNCAVVLKGVATAH